jgi:hypothetical protein
VAESPAEEAGLQEGDLITAVDGEPVEESQDLVDAIAAHEPGDRVMLTVYRLGDGTGDSIGDSIGEESQVEVTLAEHPDEEGKAYLGVFPGGFSIRMHEGRQGWWPHHEGRSSMVIVSDDPGGDLRSRFMGKGPWGLSLKKPRRKAPGSFTFRFPMGLPGFGLELPFDFELDFPHEYRDGGI